MTKLADILAEINTQLPNNVQGKITAAIERGVLDDIAAAAGQLAFDPYNLAQYSEAGDCTAALQAAVDFCFGPANNPHGANDAIANKQLIIPPGSYSISSPLLIPRTRGGKIVGSGRFATFIENTNATPVFVTNGFDYSTVSGMQLRAIGAPAVFELDWDNGAGPALQSNTFSDCFFELGQNGVRIGNSGFMGSENLFLDCFFSGCTEAGLQTRNYNALQQTVIGGNFQGCDIGILVPAGSVPNVIGVGFQVQSTYDIKIAGGAGDNYLVSGCRSESQNFLYSPADQSVAAVHITSCNHLGPSVGYFASVGGIAILDNNRSSQGKLNNPSVGHMYLTGNIFSNANVYDELGGQVVRDGARLPTTYANRPTSPFAGMIATFSDSTTTTWGATITGGGSSFVEAIYNGTNWTVTGK